MKTLILGAAAALLASTSAFATGLQHHQSPNRPTISITHVRGVSTGATNVNVQQKADYNVTSAVVLSPKASVSVDQAGSRLNAANVVVFGNRGGVNVNQTAARNSASVTVRPTPTFLLPRR